MMVLGDAHGPADDGPPGFAVDRGGLADRVAFEPGLLLDLRPRRGIDRLQIGIDGMGVLGDEVAIEHRRSAAPQRFAFPLQQVLGDAAQYGQIAAKVGAQVEAVGWRVLVGEHLDGLLRMLESFQAAFAQWIETDHLGTALQRLAQRFEHARVVGAGVLAKYEDRIGVVEIFQRYRALADTDGFGEGDAAGLVAHVRAVGKVVGAEAAAEQLVEIGRFVAGPAGCVEGCLVRAGQAVQVSRDQRERIIPGDRPIAVAGRVITHRFGETPLVFEPVIALLTQLADAVAGEEGGIHAAARGFPVHRLGAVLAELHRTGLRRIAPGATGAVEAAVLVGLEHGADVLQRIAAAEPGAGHAAQGAPAASRAGVGLEAGGGMVAGHAAHG